MDRNLPRSDTYEGSAVLYAATDGELVLRTSGEDPRLPGAIEGIEPKGPVEVATAAAAILHQRDPYYSWRSGDEGH